MDTMKDSKLLDGYTGFKCSSPKYLPTYKLKDPQGCKVAQNTMSRDAERNRLRACFFPEGVETKGEEIQLGWLDRTCWVTSSNHWVDGINKTFEFASERRIVFESDHAAVETTFQIDISNGHCLTPSLVSATERQHPLYYPFFFMIALLKISHSFAEILSGH